MAIDIIAAARRHVEEVWNKGRVELAGEFVSAKLLTHDPFFGEYTGIEGEKQHVMKLRTAFPDFKLTIEDIGLAGEKLFMRWTATGTHRGPLMGMPPTNRYGIVKGIALMRFEGGKVVETWQSWDTLGLIASLGVAPSVEKFTRLAAHA